MDVYCTAEEAACVLKRAELTALLEHLCNLAFYAKARGTDMETLCETVLSQRIETRGEM